MSFFAKNKKKKEVHEPAEAPEWGSVQAEKDVLYAPMDCEVRPIEECQNEAFAKEQLGTGMLLIPKGDVVYSPCDGKVIMLFPAKSAISVEDYAGREVLIHMGMDTVTMDGEPFEAFVKEGDEVKAGQPLMHVDWDKINRHRFSSHTPMVLTNKEKVEILKTGHVKQGQSVARIG